MTDDERLGALLDLVDPERAAQPGAGEALAVLGLAERQGRRFRPTRAGWNLLGDRGRAFDQ